MGTVSFINLPVWGIAKIFVLIGLFIYIIFGFVIVRQVKLMTDTVQTGFEFMMKLLGYIHFLFAIAVFLFALIIL